MTPAVLVAKLQARGVTLQPDGETLKVRPVSKLTPAELAALRRHKAEVLALLRAPTPAMWSLWPDALPTQGPRQVGPFVPCALCGRGTWVRYGELALCLACTADLARDGHAAELQRMLIAAFEALADGTGAGRDPAVFIESEVRRLTDEVGVERAGRIVAHTARQWYRQHGRCPWCGSEPECRHSNTTGGTE